MLRLRGSQLIVVPRSAWTIPKMFRHPKRSGFTLPEVLVVTILIGLVFVGATSLFVSQFGQYKVRERAALSFDPKGSVEELSKKISVANEFQMKSGASDCISGTGCDGLWIRVDATVNVSGSLTPNNTPAVITDDTWIKYRFFGGSDNSLRWIYEVTQNNPSPGDPPTTNVTAGDAALISNIHIGGASPNSEFSSEPNHDSTRDRVVGIRLVTQVGSGPTAEIYTQISLGAKTVSA